MYLNIGVEFNGKNYTDVYIYKTVYNSLPISNTVYGVD